ncbi:MAG: hypothetical protein F6K17_03450 [Okeania sp. SIO3C4]|nr:hypothetical protein [Okeania sp. SIO3B3]NER01750.1 hypothetical protein [Okeania sp. SIO3C4]
MVKKFAIGVRMKVVMEVKTISRRKITYKGVKPIGKEQWQFLYRWLYGLVEPSTGESFFWEFTHLNSICFEKFLELFAEK